MNDEKKGPKTGYEWLALGSKTDWKKKIRKEIEKLEAPEK
jgi:hypothetical protein